MSKIIYNAQNLKTMSLFEKITRTRVKDHFTDDNGIMTFVVQDVDLGKAVGKKAANVKKLEKMLKRKIKILGFNPSPVKFAQNLIYPFKADIDIQDDAIIMKSDDTKTKAFLIGRNQSNLKNNLNIIKKYFKQIKAIKVI